MVNRWVVTYDESTKAERKLFLHLISCLFQASSRPVQPAGGTPLSLKSLASPINLWANFRLMMGVLRFEKSWLLQYQNSISESLTHVPLLQLLQYISTLFPAGFSKQFRLIQSFAEHSGMMHDGIWLNHQKLHRYGPIDTRINRVQYYLRYARYSA